PGTRRRVVRVWPGGPADRPALAVPARAHPVRRWAPGSRRHRTEGTRGGPWPPGRPGHPEAGRAGPGRPGAGQGALASARKWAVEEGAAPPITLSPSLGATITSWHAVGSPVAQVEPTASATTG